MTAQKIAGVWEFIARDGSSAISLFAGERLKINLALTDYGDGAILTFAPADSDEQSARFDSPTGLWDLTDAEIAAPVGSAARFWIWAGASDDLDVHGYGDILRRTSIAPSGAANVPAGTSLAADDPGALNLGASLVSSPVRFFAGRRLKVRTLGDVGDGAVLVIGTSDTSGQLARFDSVSGEFDLSDTEIGAVMPEGAAYRYWLWAGPSNDRTVRSFGPIERKYAVQPTATLPVVVFEADVYEAGVFV